MTAAEARAEAKKLLIEAINPDDLEVRPEVDLDVLAARLRNLARIIHSEGRPDYGYKPLEESFDP